MKLKTLTVLVCYFPILININSQDIANKNSSQHNVESFAFEKYEYVITIDTRYYDLEDNYFITKLKSLLQDKFHPSLLEITRKNQQSAEIILHLDIDTQNKIIVPFISELGFTVTDYKKPILFNVK